MICNKIHLKSTMQQKSVPCMVFYLLHTIMYIFFVFKNITLKKKVMTDDTPTYIYRENKNSCLN